MELLLVAATWKLWFPSLAAWGAVPELGWDAAFPRVGLLETSGAVAAWLDPTLAVVWISALLGQSMLAASLYRQRASAGFASPRGVSLLYFCLGVAVFTWIGLVLLNLHRLQAWCYLAAWIQLLYLAEPALRRNVVNRFGGVIRRWQWLIVSVYFFSALSKFDLTFLQTLGSQFLTTAWNNVAAADLELETVWPIWLTLGFPLGELIVAIGLASGLARQWFVALAVVLHGLLLWLLGPWGMQHQAGVLLWNVFFIGQLYFLFWPETRSSEERTPPEAWSARAALYLVLLLPLAQNWGWCDPWMAWELYAPRVGRVQVFLAEPAVDALPPLQRYVERESSREFGPLWRELRIDQWSLEQLQAPIYPQEHFQMEVAKQVSSQVKDPDQVFFRWLGPANRWTGHREKRLD